MKKKRDPILDLRTYNKKIQRFKNYIKKFIYSLGKKLFFLKKKNLKFKDLKNINSVLFITLYFKGDVLFQTPVIEIISKLFPKAQIDVWVKSRSAELLEDNSHINEVLVFDSVRTSEYLEENRKFDLKGKYHFLRKLRSKKYDLVIDYTGLFSTSMFVFLSGSRYNFGKNEQGFGFLYNNDLSIDFSIVEGNLIKKYINLLKDLLNVENEKWEEIISKIQLKPILNQNSQISARVKDELEKRNFDLSKHLICLHLTSGWEAKRWAIENFAELIKALLTKYEFEMVVIGNDYDKSEYYKIINMLKSYVNQEKLKNVFFSFPINYNVELIRICDLFIGSDSAPLHIAGAVDTPSIALFGPTNPKFSTPIGSEHFYIYHELGCSAKPNEQYCSRNAGKTCDTLDCMKMITVKEVLDKIYHVIKNSEKLIE